MSFRAALGVCVALVGAGCGCIGGSSPQPVYYALEGGGTVGTRSRATKTLVVTRFEVHAPYDRAEVAYRSKERELRFYPFDLWASKPGRMLAEATAEHLRKAGLFADVRAGAIVGDADYELRGEVVAIEELDVSPGECRAHLAMRFALVSLADGAVVARHELDVERPVGERKPAAVARALDQILGEALEALAAAIAARLD